MKFGSGIAVTSVRVPLNYDKVTHYITRSDGTFGPTLRVSKQKKVERRKQARRRLKAGKTASTKENVCA